MNAKFITIEGTEGAGKSTNIEFVCRYLKQNEISYCVTREPGGTPVAEKIREILLANHAEPIVPLSELLLIFAARAQHIERVIKPALARGEWVISDRFTDATYAYQGAGRDLGVSRVEVLEDFVQGSMRPDLTLFLDVPLQTGMARIIKRGQLDRFEKEPKKFFERVRSAYLQRIAEHPQRYVHIDAAQAISGGQKDIQGALEVLLRQAQL